MQLSTSAMKSVLTPRELADAIGVSESSVKRWVDDGSIRANKTAGGHRRIAIAEAVRFIRNSRSVVVRPDVLGLADVESIAESFPEEGGEAEALFHFLRDGNEAEAKGLILTLYLNGWSVAEIVDGPLKESMERVGSLWSHQPEGIFFEHRATEIAFQSIVRLRSLLPEKKSRPIAIGGSAPGDVYMLPSLCAAAVLEAAGYQVINLGANLPIESLELAIDRLGASIAWLSVSANTVSLEVGPRVEDLAERLAEKGIPLVVGGRNVDRLGLRSEGALRVGRSMAELEAVAQGMQLAAGGGRRPN
jgi:excisionase family DNA binding protein